ncbi:MAG: F0F1 ATP synthase subunit delta [Peptococcaceae bacterium]|nr:F0F1 ATP synthase subunit delta [Peptococcaceae bacterium]
MLKGAVAGRYSTALYDLATEANEVDRIEEEIKAIAAAVEENVTLKQVLFHPQITVTDKKELLEAVFKDKVLPLTSNFLALLIDRRRETFLQDIVDEFVRLANKDRNIVQARIVSALELIDDEKRDIELLLTKITGQKVQSSFVVEPSLVGGVLVHIGDKVIDGSIKARLDTMRESLRRIS